MFTPLQSLLHAESIRQEKFLQLLSTAWSMLHRLTLQKNSGKHDLQPTR